MALALLKKVSVRCLRSRACFPDHAVRHGSSARVAAARRMATWTGTGSVPAAVIERMLAGVEYHQYIHLGAKLHKVAGFRVSGYVREVTFGVDLNFTEESSRWR